MTPQRAYDGSEFPAIGFGTYGLWGTSGADAVSSALRSGYTLIDSAFNYENEGAVGRGVREAEVDRSGLIVTSKLPGRHHSYDNAMRTIEESLYRMGGEAIGLYLIHWPNPKVGQYVEAWRALIEAKESGLIRRIGVSNFLPDHIDRLEAETGVLPVVNQIEIHPFFPQEAAVEYHRERGIVTEAWSPVGRATEMVDHPTIVDVAAHNGITPVQAVLAWHVARGVVPLPKSSNPERQRENLAAVDIALRPGDIDAITALGRADGRLKGQDPASYEEF